jgi:KDO2-lipid IV(A) lauroyltransferase
MPKKVRWWLEFGLLYGLFLFSRLAPRRLLLGFGRWLGWVAWYVLRIRRGVVLDNLRASFHRDRSEVAIRDLARRFYGHLGVTLMEFLTFHSTTREQIRGMVTTEGLEHLAACQERGSGAIITSGHFGNWELGGACVAAFGFPICFIIKSQSNPYVDRVQNDIRKQVGIGVIRQGASARQLVYALRNKEFVGMLADQDAGNDGLFIPFLGRPASVFRGPAYLAYRTGCPIVPSVIIRQPDGRHHVTFTPPITVDPDWDEETAVRELTRAYTKRLEEFIRRFPEQYFWVHRRWKTRPPGERT